MTFYRWHEPVQVFPRGESRTKQSHKDECDIHRILKQYSRTGVLEHVNRQAARFEDLPDHQEFQQALHTIQAGQEAFASLPSSVREHFGNNPERYLSAFNNPNEEAYLRSVGLLKPKEPPPAPNAPTPPEKD